MKKLITFLLLTPLFTLAQNQNWVFGRNIRYTQPATFAFSSVNHNEGTSCLSNAAGQIMCYSEGVNAYDRNNNIMPNGAALLGNNTTTQSALIIQQPNVPNMLYLFCMGQSGGLLSYSIVDMTLNAGLGAVTGIKNVVLNAPITFRECMAAQPSCSEDTVWVVVKRWQNANFYAYPLTSLGIGLPVISSAGFAGGAAINDPIGAMSFHPDGNRLSVCYYGNNRVESYRFNKVTGQVTFIQNYTYNQPYDTEWAENFMYVFTNDGRVHQVNACTNVSTQVGATTQTLAALGTAFYADNGTIMISRGINNFLARIANPLNAGVACGFNQNFIATTTNPMFGLQNIAMPYSRPPVQPFTFTSSCGSASLSAVTRACFEPCIYSWTGSFGTAIGQNVTVSLPNGNHSVTLERICDCETTTRVQNVSVSGGILASVIGF